MAKKEAFTHVQLLDEIRKKQFRPIYFLQGDEPYFIDVVTDALVENVLSDSERDFNQSIFYGASAQVDQIVGACRRFPMMSERQLVVVKEAQVMETLDQIEIYTKHPLNSTVLVINYKGKSFDARKKMMKDIVECGGAILDSKKLYDDKLPAFISGYVTSKGLGIDEKAAIMLSNFVGSDLSRLTGELDKLIIVLKGGKRITPEIVEQNIGISKDFNNFELLKAVINRDFYKINLIADAFAKDPKDNPPMVTVAVLFNYFANLMLSYYSPDRSEAGVMNHLGLKNTFMARDYVTGMRIYPAVKTMQIITLLRTYDAKMKGVDSTGSSSPAELMKELLYKITH